MKKLFILLLLATALALSACGSPTPEVETSLTTSAYENPVPEIEVILADSDPFPQEYIGMDRADFIEKWGEPETAEEDRDIWNVNGKFVVASYNNGKVTSLNHSSTLRTTVIELNGDLSIMESIEGQWVGAPIFFDPAWLSEPVEVGDTLVIEYSGILFATSPAQMGEPYSIAVE